MNDRVGLSRHDRKFAILKAMAQRTLDGSEPQWLTLLEIAKDQRMKPSKHLRELLAELSYHHHIFCQHGEGKNHGLRLEYMLNDDVRVDGEFAAEWKEYCEGMGA